MRNGSGATARIYPARVHFTFTTAQLLDTDAIKLSMATVASATTYPGDAALDGTLVTGGVALMRLPQVVTVTTTTQAATYNTTDAITITGTDYDGNAATDTLLLTQAGGNETVVGDVGFYTVTLISVPAMLGTSGTLQFGIRDVILPVSDTARQIRHGSDGDILVEFVGESGSALNQDTVTGLKGERHDAFYQRIYGTAATTSTPITIYL